MGAAFADYDNDGDLDLYVANYKANAFFRNEGSGSFIKFSSKAGSIGHVGFGSAVAWGDYDNDGYLDLYVANYLDYGKLPRGDEVFLYGLCHVRYYWTCSSRCARWTQACSSQGFIRSV